MRTTGCVAALIVGLVLAGCTAPDEKPTPPPEPVCSNPSVFVTRVGEPAPEIVVARLRDQGAIGDYGTVVWDTPVATQLVWDSGGDWAAYDENVSEALKASQDMPYMGDPPGEELNSLADFIHSATDPNTVVAYLAREMVHVTIDVTCGDGRQAQASALGSHLDEIGIVACVDQPLPQANPTAGDARERFCPPA